jgi:nucleotide-binding universal stress UspA family protein
VIELWGRVSAGVSQRSTPSDPLFPERNHHSIVKLRPDGTGGRKNVSNTEAAPFDRIVAGVDGSDSSLQALEWAAHQTELTGSRLDVIMTWEWPIIYGSTQVPFDYDPRSDAETWLGEAVKKLRERRPALNATGTVVEGHPAPVLVEESRTADLLVLGSRGHGEFVGMLLGSVSEHCVTNAHCPVVVVRDRQ